MEPLLTSTSTGAVVATGWYGSFLSLFSGVFSIPVFLALNASFVAIEFSLVSIRRTRVRELAMSGVPGSRRLEHAVTHLDRYLAATQLGITGTSLGLGWLGEPAMARLLLGFFERFAGPGFSAVAAHTVSFSIAFLGISFLHVVLGELVPRTVALRMTDRVALLMVRPLVWFERIFHPITWVFQKSGHAVVRLLRMKPSKAVTGAVHSVTELHILADASERDGVLEPQEKEMIHGVLAIGDMTVRDAMVARDEITGVKLSDPLEKIVQVALESGYSRLPVFDASGEEAVGIIHSKDLLTLFSETERDLIVFQDLLRQPFFVRPDRRLLDVLRVFQAGEEHLALVQDEFGEIVGLITLEDLLEEIVGDIRDEYDSKESTLRLGRDGSFIAHGHVSARECLLDLGSSPEADLAGSLGDFLVDRHGGGMREGEQVVFGDLTFTVLEADRAGWPRKIRIVKGTSSR